jgi:archaellum biogenesis ATPase FlaH
LSTWYQPLESPAILSRYGPEPIGDGKTYLAQSMAIAIAHGNQFLGMPCRQSPVLYIDLENAAYVVQDRLRSMSKDESVPELRVWGIWNEQQPPQFGSELLLTIGKETKPVIIIDPFRYFHTAEENDSTAMSAVMQYLRALAAYGCAVVILHHPAKSEGSTGRGSSVIRGACDIALLHSLERESGLITLKVDKNRNGASRKITIQADFEEGKFEMTDSPYITRRNDELDKLEQIIKAEPGISQNAIWKAIGAQRNRVLRLLKEGTGTRWTTEKGKYGANLYQHLANPLYPNDGTAGTTHSEQSCTAVPTPLGVVQGTALRGPETMTACPYCGSFAVYSQPNGQHNCMTCEGSFE